MTQETLVETLGITKFEVSKVEHRNDVWVRTLRRHIEATGSELEMVARVLDGEVEIVQTVMTPWQPSHACTDARAPSSGSARAFALLVA